MRAIRNLYVENEVTYKTCDSCNAWKIVYTRLAITYVDKLLYIINVLRGYGER